MKLLTRFAFPFSLLFATAIASAQAPAEFRTVPAPLVIDGKWVMSSYDYDRAAGEYYFVTGGKRVLFDDHFKSSKDYIKNTIYADMLTITYNGKKYERFGLPRIIGFDDAKIVGSYNGLLVFTEKDAAKTPAMILIPHSAEMGGVDFNVYNLKK